MNNYTTDQINTLIIARFEGLIGQSVPILPKSFIRIVSKVFAGAFIILYKYAGFMHLQMFVQTASYELTEINGIKISPLKFWGDLVGIGDRKNSVRAELLVNIKVFVLGGTIAQGTQLISQNNILYLFKQSVLLDSYNVQAVVRATADYAGTVGNMLPGQSLRFVNAQPYVDDTVYIDSIYLTGTEAESVDDYRQRILNRFQMQPRGGAYADYKHWGEETDGIIRIYPYTSDQAGQINIYVESDSDDRLPTAAQLEAVLYNINYDQSGLASRRSANAWVNVYPVTVSIVDVEIYGVTGIVDFTYVSEQIKSDINTYVKDLQPFIIGLSSPPRKDTLSAMEVASIIQTHVSNNLGTFSSIVLKIDNNIVVNFILLEGQVVNLGNVTFI